MTIKTANNGDAVVTETMADRLRAVQSEPWRKMRFVDENELEAWDVFSQTFVPLREIKEGGEEDAEEEVKSLNADLDKVPWLETPWGVDDIEAKIARRQAVLPFEQPKQEAGPGDGTKVKPEPTEPLPLNQDTRAARSRARAPATTARRGRSKTGARGGSTTAMEID